VIYFSKQEYNICFMLYQLSRYLKIYILRTKMAIILIRYISFVYVQAERLIMNKLSGMIIISTLTLAVIVVLLLLTPTTSQFAWAQGPASNTSSSNPAIFLPDSQPYGLTYGEWTAKWWQWAHSITTENNPQLDETGEDCTQAQNQTGPVWFLAGTSGGSAERTCTIPAGKAILIPIINAAYVGTAGETEEDMRTGVKEWIDTVTTLEGSIDGVPLQNLSNYRVQSPAFNDTLPNDNVLGEPEGTYLAVSDGYWIFLEPLPPGEHEIRLHGVIIDPAAISPTPSFETAVTYHLIVSDTAIPSTEQGSNATTNNTTAVLTNP
jgi:hypothetical protein